MKNLFVLLAFLTFALALTSCETTKGVGRDIQYLGRTISGDR